MIDLRLGDFLRAVSTRIAGMWKKKEEAPAIVMQGKNVGRPTLTSSAEALRMVRLGMWIMIGAILPIALWTAFAQLSLAVVAPAVVKVDLNRRPVQHLEGGIVRSVLVRDGQHVKAGDPVLYLGDVAVAADLNRLDYRIHVERAAIARLEAEQTHAARLVFPPSLLSAAEKDERVKQAQVQETALFRARRDSLESEVALMRTAARAGRAGDRGAARADHASRAGAHPAEDRSRKESGPAADGVRVARAGTPARSVGSRLRVQAGRAPLRARTRRAASGGRRAEDPKRGERVHAGGER